MKKNQFKKLMRAIAEINETIISQRDNVNDSIKDNPPKITISEEEVKKLIEKWNRSQGVSPQHINGNH